MIDDFIIRALIAGFGIAVISGFLGCFVIWRRISYFGDSLSHSALLGVALGLLLGINTNVPILIICTLFAFILVWLEHQNVLSVDTLLGILAHSTLSLGMVTISLLDTPGFNLHNYLFGDILTVSYQEIYWIYLGGVVVVMLLAYNWAPLTLMAINEDLAQAEGVNTLMQHTLLMLLMSVVVAVSIPIVGILLVTSLLIIPPASARLLASSPHSMAIIAVVLGVISVKAGILGSIIFDTPSGPSIVVFSALSFALILLLSTLNNRYKNRVSSRNKKN